MKIKGVAEEGRRSSCPARRRMRSSIPWRSTCSRPAERQRRDSQDLPADEEDEDLPDRRPFEQHRLRRFGEGQLEKLAPQHGITIVANEVYDKAASDLTAEVTKIKAANVQAIVNWSIEPAQAIVIKNARQIGLKSPSSRATGSGTSNTSKPPARRPKG